MKIDGIHTELKFIIDILIKISCWVDSTSQTEAPKWTPFKSYEPSKFENKCWWNIKIKSLWGKLAEKTGWREWKITIALRKLALSSGYMLFLVNLHILTIIFKLWGIVSFEQDWFRSFHLRSGVYSARAFDRDMIGQKFGSNWMHFIYFFWLSDPFYCYLSWHLDWDSVCQFLWPLHRANAHLFEYNVYSTNCYVLCLLIINNRSSRPSKSSVAIVQWLVHSVRSVCE
jgi:hypothetical protein